MAHIKTNNINLHKNKGDKFKEKEYSNRECKGKMIEKTGKTPEGFAYQYYKCRKCGEEIINMKQLCDISKDYIKKGKSKLRPEFIAKMKQISKQKSIRTKNFAKKYGLN